jgi:hypothetical protein
MKKEWMYFIAGAGLIAVVIFSLGLIKDTLTNCKDVALYANADSSVNKDDLTDREIQIALKLYEERPRLTSTTKKRGDHAEMYTRCVAIEGAF